MRRFGVFSCIGGTAVSDLDECALNGTLEVCAQICNNTEGSYECSCEHGYITDPLDDSQCIGIVILTKNWKFCIFSRPPFFLSIAPPSIYLQTMMSAAIWLMTVIRFVLTQKDLTIVAVVLVS